MKQYDKKVHWKNYRFSVFKFISIHFWKYAKQQKHSNFSFKPSNQLITEKTIILNGDDDDDCVDGHVTNRCVLYIGLNPEDKFKIYARLEKRIRIRKSWSNAHRGLAHVCHVTYKL